MADPSSQAADPSDAYARTAETFPQLTDAQAARVASFGVVEDLPAGTVLFEPDERGVDFFLVLRGCVEIYQYDAADRPVVITVHGENQFTGELDLFNERAILVGGRLGADSRVARAVRSSAGCSRPSRTSPGSSCARSSFAEPVSSPTTRRRSP